MRPISLKEANGYVLEHHRHHKPCTGCKFCLSVYDNDRLCGVAICGRPIAREYDNGKILEINRVCTDGTKNACSFLYGAASRIAKIMGYEKIITYTLKSEDGASLRASGFTCEGEAGKEMWTGKRSARDNGVPKEKKHRWVKELR
jgi:hypothetical protein